MNLPTVSDADFQDKLVAIRIDCDIDIEDGKVVDDARLVVSLPTIQKALDQGARKIFLLGHRKRPDGFDQNLSTQPLADYFQQKLSSDVCCVKYKDNFGQYSKSLKNSEARVVLADNLRFWKCETDNCPEFAQTLADLADVYVNDAFASSHREHASVYGAMKIHLNNNTGYFGERFVAEIEHLSKVLENPQKPVVFLLSGVKEDKLKYLDKVIDFSDKVLVSGRLPKYLDEDYNNPKVVVARLIMDNEDITIHSMEAFESEIKSAGTVVVSGPMGKFEDEGHRQGTKRVLEAVANSNAYKVAGGGDTEHAISMLGIKDKFDWVSIGGGAMLEYLTNRSLPILDEVVH